MDIIEKEIARLCDVCAKVVFVIGTIGSIGLAYTFGNTISYNYYSSRTYTERDWILTIIIFLTGTFSSFIMYLILEGTSHILKNQEDIKTMIKVYGTNYQKNKTHSIDVPAVSYATKKDTSQNVVAKDVHEETQTSKMKIAKNDNEDSELENCLDFIDVFESAQNIYEYLSSNLDYEKYQKLLDDIQRIADKESELEPRKDQAIEVVKSYLQH